MIVRVARYFNLTEAETYDTLEKDIRRLYCYLRYKELIRPLVNWDYKKEQFSIRRLAIKYDVPRSTISRMLTGK